MSDLHAVENPGHASPTGLPRLPVRAVPYIVGILGLAATAVQVLPQHTIAFKVAAFIVSLGGVFGAASPGLRR